MEVAGAPDDRSDDAVAEPYRSVAVESSLDAVVTSVDEVSVDVRSVEELSVDVGVDVEPDAVVVVVVPDVDVAPCAASAPVIPAAAVMLATSVATRARAAGCRRRGGVVRRSLFMSISSLLGRPQPCRAYPGLP
ncbi:MAG: hypothetical protein E6G68_02250 [Actinobacteria bacterium]|nr:MAG: hypothetical protein E6G68_02250 [Actinomycetota bacterium]